METVLEFDQQFFFWINQGLSNEVLDRIMPIWREKTTWIPLYILLLVLSFIRLKWKKALVFALLVAATVGIADQTSSEWIKKSVKRVRPCKDAEVSAAVNLPMGRCGSGYSFTSSHATNHFAVATFIAFVLFAGSLLPQLLLFFWAASIGFGQIYVGLHYPLDVIVGSILGFLIGYSMYQIYQLICRQWLRL